MHSQQMFNECIARHNKSKLRHKDQMEERQRRGGMQCYARLGYAMHNPPYIFFSLFLLSFRFHFLF